MVHGRSASFVVAFRSVQIMTCCNRCATDAQRGRPPVHKTEGQIMIKIKGSIYARRNGTLPEQGNRDFTLANVPLWAGELDVVLACWVGLWVRESEGGAL